MSGSGGPARDSALSLGRPSLQGALTEAAPLASAQGQGSAGEVSPLISVRGLHVDFHTRDRVVNAVSGVSFDVSRGEIVAIVGESGSGKSATALSLLGLTREAGATLRGSVIFAPAAAPALPATDMLTAPRKRLQALRGACISMVFQDPLSSLNPVQRVGAQVAEQVRAHRDVTKAEAHHVAMKALERAGLRAARCASSYPHQLSGGQRQRAMIAMAISCDPVLLVADEPTTALDVTTQAAILTELSRLRAETGLSVVLVTHDLAVVSKIADRILVMSAGRIVEQGRQEEIFERPQSDEAQLLLRSITRLYGRGPATSPEARPHAKGEDGPEGVSGERQHVRNGVSGKAPLLELSGLSVTYEASGEGGPVVALDGVSIEVCEGETLGVVGESGCGKSTLLRCASRLLPVEAGTIRFEGVDVTRASRRALKPLRSGVQMVFQDPDASLNPRHTVERILLTPLRLRGVTRSEAKRQVPSLLAEVGLEAEHARRFPHELSGGQRQRVGIARALAMEPKLLLLDEPVSSLDVSVRAEIVELLKGLGRSRGLASVFVAHDIALVANVSDRIAVMFEGRIVEQGSTETVCLSPSDPYTQALLKAAPSFLPAAARA